jgi:hypothetical protein
LTVYLRGFQKNRASKPEAQAEGNRVCRSGNHIPSARGSGFPECYSAKRTVKTPAV